MMFTKKKKNQVYKEAFTTKLNRANLENLHCKKIIEHYAILVKCCSAAFGGETPPC